MFRFLLLTVFVGTALTTAHPTVADARDKPVLLAQAADPAVTKANQDLDSLEFQANALNPGDTTTGRQLMNDMKPVEKSLMAVADKKYPEWRRAAQRYMALQKKVVATANAKSTQPAGGVEPVVKEVAAILTAYDAKAEALPSDDKATLNQYLTDLRAAATKLKSAKNQGHPEWKKTSAQFSAVWKKIVTKLKAPHTAKSGGANGPIDTSGLISQYQVRLKRLARSVESTRNNIRGANLDAMRQKSTINTFNNSINSLCARAAKFPDANQPGVAEVSRRIETVAALLKSKIAENQAALGALGDVDGQLTAIDKQMSSSKVPLTYDEDGGPEAVVSYVTNLLDLRVKAQEAAKTLAKLKAAGIRDDRIGSLNHWAVNDRQRKINESLGKSTGMIDRRIEQYMRSVDFHKTTDPNDQNHRANRLLGEGTFDSNLVEFDKGLAAVAIARAFDGALNRTDGPDRAQQLKAFEVGRTKYEADYATALSSGRMPDAKMTDAKHMKIAKETLSNPKYESINHPIERLVINTEVQRREKKEATLSPGTVSATISLDHWVWDQFQVATAEKVGDDYYIFYNTLKFFHKGASTTPLNRWVLSGRFQSSQISKENISK